MSAQLPGAEAVAAVDVTGALRRHFARPEWFLFFEVTLGDRRMDALAIHCYESHGWSLVGMEIKTNRADWLRELRDPAKGDALYQRTDEWYIVAPDGIVQPEEVPAGWGWIRVNARGCRRMKRPPERRSALVDRELLMRFLFMSEDRERVSLARAAAERYTEEAPRIKKAVEDELRYRQDGRNDLQKHYTDLQESVRAFENASGIRIDNYSGPRLGEDVAALQSLRQATADSWYLGEVERNVKNAVEAVAHLRAALEGARPPSADGPKDPA